MNILKDVKKKNPLKSYDYKGFDVICIATCGERGTIHKLKYTYFIGFLRGLYLLYAPKYAPHIIYSSN